MSSCGPAFWPGLDLLSLSWLALSLPDVGLAIAGKQSFYLPSCQPLNQRQPLFDPLVVGRQKFIQTAVYNMGACADLGCLALYARLARVRDLCIFAWLVPTVPAGNMHSPVFPLLSRLCGLCATLHQSYDTRLQGRPERHTASACSFRRRAVCVRL